MVAMQVTPEQSLALVEYIAHLSVEDWDGIARDLRNLGFVPAGETLLTSQSERLFCVPCRSCSAQKYWIGHIITMLRAMPFVLPRLHSLSQPALCDFAAATSLGVKMVVRVQAQVL